MTNQQLNKSSYDAIIIGSGMGALTVASILSQLQGKRILILEQHYVAGGFTHTFKREKGYKWDVGIHYVGDLEDGHKFRRLFDFVTRGGVQWQKMPYIYDKFVFPDFTVEAPSDQDSLKDLLISLFPHEEKALRQYFSDVVRADGWYRKHILYKHIPNLLKPFVKPSKAETLLSTTSTKDYLDANFSDQKLKGVLTCSGAIMVPYLGSLLLPTMPWLCGIFSKEDTTLWAVQKQFCSPSNRLLKSKAEP